VGRALTGFELDGILLSSRLGYHGPDARLMHWTTPQDRRVPALDRAGSRRGTMVGHCQASGWTCVD
jgi:hypothetical protein